MPRSARSELHAAHRRRREAPSLLLRRHVAGRLPRGVLHGAFRLLHGALRLQAPVLRHAADLFLHAADRLVLLPLRLRLASSHRATSIVSLYRTFPTSRRSNTRGDCRLDASRRGADGTATDLAVTRRGRAGAYRLQLRCDRTAVEDSHGRQERPEPERDDPCQRSVRLAERGAEPEEQTQPDRRERPDADRHERSEAEPRPGRLAATWGPPVQQGDGRHREGESDRPPDYVPDLHRGMRPERCSDRVTHAERDEGGRDQQPRGDGEGERVHVLAGGGAILFDPVDPVQSALQLAHQDHAGDQDGHDSEDQGRRAIRRAGLMRLVHGLCHQLARRTRRGALKRLHAQVGEVALADCTSETEHDDDPLDHDQHRDERHAASVTRPVGRSEPAKGVTRQTGAAGGLERFPCVVPRELPCLRHRGGRAQLASPPTQIATVAGSIETRKRFLDVRSPPSSSYGRLRSRRMSNVRPEDTWTNGDRSGRLITDRPIVRAQSNRPFAVTTPISSFPSSGSAWGNNERPPRTVPTFPTRTQLALPENHRRPSTRTFITNRCSPRFFAPAQT